MRACDTPSTARPGNGVGSPRPGPRSDTFAALRSFNYRLYFLASMFATTGSWMQRVALDWLVLELTGNVALVGLAVSLQFAPTLLFGVWSGVISDRVSRRKVLICTQFVTASVNATLASLVILGVVEAWHVFTAAAVLGLTIAVDAPSRSAFITEMVGTERLPNAISLNASVFHLGGLVGPVISGVLIAVIGSGWSIGANAVTALVAAGTLVAMRTRELVAVPRAPRGQGMIHEAVRYALDRPTILWPLVLLGSVAVFGMNLPVLLAASASGRYGTGAGGYGLYSSLAAAGAFIGAVLSARRRTVRLRTIVAWAVVYGVVTAFGGLAPWYGGFLAALVGLGIARILFATGAESMTQLSSDHEIRGRVMSFYLMVLLGGQALGGVILGWVCQLWGSGVGFIVAGAGPALVAVIVGGALARAGRLRLAVVRDLRHPFRIVSRDAEDPVQLLQPDD